jgi:hypothetical protein
VADPVSRGRGPARARIIARLIRRTGASEADYLRRASIDLLGRGEKALSARGAAASPRCNAAVGSPPPRGVHEFQAVIQSLGLHIVSVEQVAPARPSP